MLLYVTGLTQWLIKRGLLQDHDVNFSSLRPYWVRAVKSLRSHGIRSAGFLLQVFRRVVEQARQFVNNSVK